MFPRVYRTLRTPAVIAIVGDRIGRHGEVAQDEARPYITWHIVTEEPHTQLSGAPCSYATTVQIDCRHASDAGIEQLALAVREALDAALIVNRVRVNDRDTTTRLYRVAIDADFFSIP